MWEGEKSLVTVVGAMDGKSEAVTRILGASVSTSLGASVG